MGSDCRGCLCDSAMWMDLRGSVCVMSPKLETRIVSLLGSVALASVAGYFAALLRALFGESEAWSALFGKHLLVFLYVPFCLMLLYFYARVQLGRRLLERGELEAAVAWCEPRQHYSFWLRGKREALIQRLVLGRAYLAQGKLDEAHRVLWQREDPLPERAPELVALHRWRLECALRREDLKEARQVVTESAQLKSKKGDEFAALLATRAELELRASAWDEVGRLLEEARWNDAGAWRASCVDVLRAAQAPQVPASELERVLEREAPRALEGLRCALPGAVAEHHVALAQVQRRLHHEDEAEAQLEAARAEVERGAADGRSRWCVSRADEARD